MPSVPPSDTGPLVGRVDVWEAISGEIPVCICDIEAQTKSLTEFMINLFRVRTMH
jgi:hypothetical protein